MPPEIIVHPPTVKRSGPPLRQRGGTRSHWQVFRLRVLLFCLAVSGARGAQSSGDSRSGLTFACAANNDLFQVLCQTAGRAHPRFPSALDAVRSAPTDSGVLLLADGYPDRTLSIDPAVLRLANSKRLRLYLEYPESLPSFEVGKPERSRFARGVVTDAFFGAGLPSGRILALNDLYLVPLRADGGLTHAVAARVAGFDTAVYGLPDKINPLLVEFPKGRILVATTALSRFVTGRYAPAESWRTFWQTVLKWLCPSDPPPTLRWKAMVRPAFGPREPLPAGVELVALDRGIDWFLRSKLLLHSSRLEEVNRAATGDGMLPTPPADAPSGDGSLGILEGPLSVVLTDGSQMQSVSRRGDCTGESAMALALGGRQLDDPAKIAIARRLLDFYYFTSDARRRERGDPAHGAYGLTAWGIGSPAWYKANYGDDNARLMLGTMATAAVTGERRWDEAVMRCLLANLRTTGRLGFRGDRIDIEELAGGWKPFYEREIVNLSPHMEAYLWACFVRAFQLTGDTRFIERTLNAIRAMMSVYPNGWRWTNGLAQERARMLLPLAWLVRAQDTPEHRQWLQQAVEGLLTLQEPCGAIREELGLPGRGMFPPPSSNEEYGVNEASLIQRNGDPASDMLYTVNFAFLGLHEANAAVREPSWRLAEDKLAEFLCRIQVRSEIRPELDGGWFRAFDFKRWEHWGSNADAGWGAWAIESGWTQGWITTVLALRQTKTSFWDLTAGSRIADPFDRLQGEMLPDRDPRK